MSKTLYTANYLDTRTQLTSVVLLVVAQNASSGTCYFCQINYFRLRSISSSTTWIRFLYFCRNTVCTHVHINCWHHD